MAQQSIKIISWNVNSIKARIAQVKAYIIDQQPDIILLQELKCTDDNFPTSEFEELGYNVAVRGQKTYNGVAILSRFIIEDITNHFYLDPDQDQARYIEAVVNVANNMVIRVASVYVPNGQQVGSEKFYYKLKFLESLKLHLQNLLKLEEILIIGGDFNVAPEAIDTYDSEVFQDKLCYHIDERKHYSQILNIGLIDSYRILNNQQEFSWWDYRGGAWQHNLGLRIDHLLLSAEAADLLLSSRIDKYTRGQLKSSDHAPVVCELNTIK